MKANDIVKDEFKDKYRYVGGLRSEFLEDSVNYKTLENWLCNIDEIILMYSK